MSFRTVTVENKYQLWTRLYHYNDPDLKRICNVEYEAKVRINPVNGVFYKE